MPIRGNHSSKDVGQLIEMRSGRRVPHTHTIHGTGIFTYVWLIFYGKCRQIHHTWMLWDSNDALLIASLKLGTPKTSREARTRVSFLKFEA